MSEVPHPNRSMHRKLAVAGLAVLLGVPLLLAGCRAPGMVPDSLHTMDLRIITWNLEHLNDTDEAGCVPREQADYALRRRSLAGPGIDPRVAPARQSPRPLRRLDRSPGESHNQARKRIACRVNRQICYCIN